MGFSYGQGKLKLNFDVPESQASMDPEPSNLFITYASPLKHISKLTENGIKEAQLNCLKTKQNKIPWMFDKRIVPDRNY